MPTPPSQHPAPTVRRTREAEWEAAKTLRLQALRADPLAFGSTYVREAAFTDDLWRERTSKGASSAESSQWIAEAADGTWVGMTAAALVSGAFHIFAMWVDPEWRGLGVGGKLLDAALRWIEEVAPGESVELQVNPRQKEAVRLYESRGFRSTGAVEPLGHTEGETVSTMLRPPHTKP